MPPDQITEKPVIIIGGGWAGISAAIHLAKQGKAVTLIEAAKQLGGRARMVMFDNLPVDNGQHIALGAYRNMLELLKIIGLDESYVFKRLPLALHVIGDETTVDLKAPKIPAPFHLFVAFLKTTGLSSTDKAKTIFNWLRLIGTRARSDMTVSDLLHCTGQSERVNHYLWKPLCIASLNTNPEIASARVFQRVLKDAFMRRRADSDILLPRYDLGRVLPQPAQTWLSQHNVKVLTQERVTGLQFNSSRISGIITNQRSIDAEQVILATDISNSTLLIKNIPALASLHTQLTQFEYEPITTVYLKYQKPVLLNPTMQGLADTTTQWLFDRRITSHPKIVAAVISAAGEHTKMTKEKIVQMVINDIKSTTPLQADPVNSMVVREKRATFSATPKAETLRPDNKTALQGLWLAGDYTNTDYPATLEGAVMSGKSAVQNLLMENHHE